MLVEVSASVTKSRNGLMKKETSKTGFEISLEYSSDDDNKQPRARRNGNSGKKDSIPK